MFCRRGPPKRASVADNDVGGHPAGRQSRDKGPQRPARAVAKVTPTGAKAAPQGGNRLRVGAVRCFDRGRHPDKLGAGPGRYLDNGASDTALAASHQRRLAGQWLSQPRVNTGRSPERNATNPDRHQPIFNAIPARDPVAPDTALRDRIAPARKQVPKTFNDLRSTPPIGQAATAAKGVSRHPRTTRRRLNSCNPPHDAPPVTSNAQRHRSQNNQSRSSLAGQIPRGVKARTPRRGGQRPPPCRALAQGATARQLAATARLAMTSTRLARYSASP